MGTYRSAYTGQQIDAAVSATTTNTAGLSGVVDNYAKNIIQNNIIRVEKNGVVATVNPDKSITLTGTSTKSTAFTMFYDFADATLANSYSTKIPVKAGQYVLKGTGDSRAKIQAMGYTDDSDCDAYANIKDDKTFTVTTKPYISFRLYIAANANFTTPLTIYPMCSLKSTWDISQTYVPYQPDMEALAADFTDFTKYENPVAVEWIDGKFISSSGVEGTDPNYSHSTPFKIRKGQRLVYSATGASSTSILTKYVNGSATIIIDGSVEVQKRFIIPKKFWIADEDCTLVITHRITTTSSNNNIVANEDVRPTIYNDEQFLSGSPLWKKKIVVFGDSLVHGSKIGEYPTWLTWIAAKYRMTAVNAGINGSTIAELPNGTDSDGDDHDPIVNRYQDVLRENLDTDIIVVEGGANDRTQAIPLGDATSTTKTEFSGAINRIINGSRILCPKAKIFFMSLPWRWTLNSTLGLNEKDYADAMKATCQLKSIPCRNPCLDGDIDFRDTYVASWADEGLWPGIVDPEEPKANRHYSPEGYQFIIPRVEKFLNQ